MTYNINNIHIKTEKQKKILNVSLAISCNPRKEIFFIILPKEKIERKILIFKAKKKKNYTKKRICFVLIFYIYKILIKLIIFHIY